jgi:hypothetical protein
MKLMKELPKIAARILKNTRGAHPDLKSRLELLEEAYGASAVARDFDDWCNGKVLGGENPKYPFSEYMKVVDSRLGHAPEETKLDIKDPQVAELVSLSYEMTSILPSATSVAKLLALYPLAEVKDALVEFTESLEEKNVRGGMYLFYNEGGADAIILVRRRRSSNG